ncbi:MAG TPA: type II secretion system protein [Candidatus Dormibacteraeota bacterium]|nr:type II secretion system protein [Candidatus Dormibacteraeota bacterium]
MNKTIKTSRQQGFSLLEMMVSVAIFTIVAGAAFGLLSVSQKRQRTETAVLDTFQEARLGLDQIVRDSNDAGYPAANQFTVAPAANTAPANSFAVTPVAWSPNYAVPTPCTIGGSCVSPGNFDLIIETDIDPAANNGVEWVRYKLVGTTLWRGVVSKSAADPMAATDAVLFPYVRNVMNNAPAAQIARYQATYPAMFPGGNPVPIFTYFCDPPAGGAAVPCTAANNPSSIRDIGVTLIVLATETDAQTNRPRLVELSGRGHRINPNK